MLRNEPSSDPALTRIDAKLAAGDRLNQADGEALFASPDLHGLGRLAHRVRQRLHGDVAFFNVNRHINYTNVCVLDCRFCGFRRRPDDPDAYTLSVEQVVEQARQAHAAGATEVHIVGGLHPTLPLDYYLAMVAGIRQACPRGSLHVKALTAIEIVHIARMARMDITGVLQALIAAGLDSLPGGGAEVFSERVAAETFRGKAAMSQPCAAGGLGATGGLSASAPCATGGDKSSASAGWFAVHRAAHALGLPTNATLLYGHVETPAERAAHVIRLRELQDETRGFQAFVPLSFQPAAALSHLPGPTGLDDLRTVAVARLMLDNIPHIKTFWVMTGPKLSQVALLFGADDIDGTVVTYDITHREGAGRQQEMTVEQMQTLIRQAGLTPVERDSVYRPVKRNPGG